MLLLLTATEPWSRLMNIMHLCLVYAVQLSATSARASAAPDVGDTCLLSVEFVQLVDVAAVSNCHVAAQGLSCIVDKMAASTKPYGT